MPRRGFLFSTQGPSPKTKNQKPKTESKSSSSRTIVIPRADRTLLRNLSLALSELRAGNEGERETCVQLSREAKRRGILPPHLMTREEMMWSTYK